MALHFCGKFAKIYLAVMNIIYVVVGFTLIGIGVAFFVEKDEFQVLTGDNNLIVGLGFITGGIFTSLIAFLGIISAIGEIPGLLVVYSLLSFGLIGLELTSASISYVQRHEITRTADKKFTEYMNKYRDPGQANYSSKVNEVIDVVQSALHCCGVSGYKTWQVYNPDYFDAYNYPSSCECSETSNQNCVQLPKSNGNTNDNVPKEGVWGRGCNETFYGAIGQNFASIGSAGLAIGLIQVLTAMMGFLLCATIIHSKAKDRRDDRIRAAAYTQMESFNDEDGDDQDNREGHEQLHAQHQSGAMNLVTSDIYTDGGGTDDDDGHVSGTLMSEDGSSSPFVTHTLDHDMEPNDDVEFDDSSMYIK